jgi:hydrogenase maturation factor HypF (carbamoyltransferase family)
MDDFYLCPDCRSEHAEPHEAVLGHIARCVSCAMLLEVLAEKRAFLDEIVEIRVAA